jgi:RNA polymerase sigma-70 factor (ECF subfamily)
VFLSIARSIEGWVPGEFQPPFRAWLTTIARNAITKALTRRPRDEATGSTSMVDLLNAQPNPEQTTAEILAEARTELVRWAGEQIRTEFSETTWNLFWLTAIEGVSIAEVAQSSGRSAGAIYVARFRVMTRLKEKVSEASQLWDLHESES